MAAAVQLSWTDRSGTQKFASGRVIDVSETGLRVEMREPLEKQSYVSLRAEKIGLQGSASVRSCIKRAGSHVIGLEFSGGLKWKPKA